MGDTSSIVLITLPLGILAVVGYVFLLRKDERWILAAIPINLIVFLEKVEHINLNKIVYTAFFFPALFIWFFRKWTKGERVVERSDELVFMLFLLYSFASVFWATYQSHDNFLRGMREFYIFLPYLFYFPVKEYVTDYKKLAKLIWTFLITCTLAAFYIIYIYKSATVDATHIWTILWSRKNLSEPLYMSAILILLSMIASRAYGPRLTVPLLAVNTLSLGLTFTRGYWVVTAIGIVLLLIFLKRSARYRLTLYLVGGSLAMLLVAVIVFPHIFSLLLDVLSMRVSSISLNSVSLKDRAIESAALLQGIKGSPIIGSGLGSEFSFYEILEHFTLTTYYIHNAYLFLLYKLGIIGTVMYLYFYIYRLVYAAKIVRKLPDDDPHKAMVLSFVIIFSVMLIVTVTSPQFNDKVPVLVLSVLWGASAGLGRSVVSSG